MATATTAAAGLRAQVEQSSGPSTRADAGAPLTCATDATPLERGDRTLPCSRETTDEVAGVLRIADERRVAVIARGSGTNLSGGAAPHRGGIVLVP